MLDTNLGAVVHCLILLSTGGPPRGLPGRHAVAGHGPRAATLTPSIVMPRELSAPCPGTEGRTGPGRFRVSLPTNLETFTG